MDHVTTKRELALALLDNSDRASLFAGWHATMRNADSQLTTRARDAGTVRTDLTDLTACDLLALAGSIALTGCRAFFLWLGRS